MDDSEWQTTFKAIKDSRDKIYSTIDVAIKNEENENPDLAIINYKLSVVLIDEALSIPVGIPDNGIIPVDDSWGEACTIIHKLKQTRGEVVQRIGSLSIKYQAASSAAHSADSDQELPAINIRRPRTYSELALKLTTIESSNASNASDELQLIFACENVKIYNIESNGVVTTTSDRSVLRILSLVEDDVQQLQATYFLQIIPEVLAIKSAEDNEETSAEEMENDIDRSIYDNPYIYPLVPGTSPCFYTDFGAFMFPDLHSNTGGAVGIMVPNEYEHIILEILEAILHGVVKQLSDEHKISARSTSEIVSENIVKGAHCVSRGLISGSTKVGEFVSRHTPYVMSKIEPVPENSTSVPAHLVTGVQLAKSATYTAVNITGYVAGKVGAASIALGRFLAPHVQSQGSRLLSHTMGYSQEQATEKMSDVLTIAAGAVEGFGTVYSGLEQSASVLGTSISNNSVKVIEHKYGSSAGELAAGTFDTVGNVINISQNIGFMTPKGFVKKTAKGAGKAMFQDYTHTTVSGHKRYILAGTLYPDLSEFSKAVSRKDST